MDFPLNPAMRRFRTISAIFALLALPGCAGLMTSATNRMADNLSAAMLNQDDPETVEARVLVLVPGLTFQHFAIRQ